MNDLYNVETVEQGKSRKTTMRGVDYTDAQEHIRQLIDDKIHAGYMLIDRKPTIILLRNPRFQSFVINLRKYVEVPAS